MRKPKILFVVMPTIPLSDIEAGFAGKGMFYQALAMPLGAMYLSSWIKKDGAAGEVALLDYALGLKRNTGFTSLEEFITGLAVKTAGSAPDIIGFSLVMSSAYKFFEKCAAGLRKLWPDAVTVAGGTHATNTSDLLLKNPDIDYVIRGEGELGLAEFIRRFDNIKDSVIKGVLRKEDANGARASEVCEFISDLDTIPFPDWSLIDMGEYCSEKGRKKSIGEAKDSLLASLITSRGCPYNCTFCSSHTVHGKRMRFRSVENVLAEIKELHERYGATLFIPEDDLFTAKKERFLSMLSGMRSLGVPGLELQFPNALRVNDLDEEMIDALVDSGQKVVVLAVESGSAKVQKLIKKNVDLARTKEVTRMFRERGVVVRCYFILGFPGETEELMRETIEYTRELGADWCNFIIATPLVGSEMYSQLIENGSIGEDFFTGSDITFSERQFDTPEISAAELNDLAYRANLDVNFINNVNRREGNWEQAIRIYQDIIDSYPFHIIGRYCVAQCKRSAGDEAGAKEEEQIIRELIRDDSRARGMYENYGALMEGFDPGGAAD